MFNIIKLDEKLQQEIGNESLWYNIMGRIDKAMCESGIIELTKVEEFTIKANHVIETWNKGTEIFELAVLGLAAVGEVKQELHKAKRQL